MGKDKLLDKLRELIKDYSGHRGRSFQADCEVCQLIKQLQQLVKKAS